MSSPAVPSVPTSSAPTSSPATSSPATSSSAMATLPIVVVPRGARGPSFDEPPTPPRDPLELMMLHGDCAFLLDLWAL